MIFVFDLDGTLADDVHRRWLIEGVPRDAEPDLWASYWDLARLDKPIEATRTFFQALFMVSEAPPDIEIWTGRPESYREKTLEWLRWNVFFDDPCRRVWENSIRLRMRANGDARPDSEVKRDWVREVGAGNIACAIEDRPSVVSMFTDHKIFCLLRIGEE